MFKATHVIKYPEETVEVQSTGKGRAVDVAGCEHSLFVPAGTTVTRIEPRESAEPPETVESIPVVSVLVDVKWIRLCLELFEMAIDKRLVMPTDAVELCRDELRKAIANDDSKGGE